MKSPVFILFKIATVLIVSSQFCKKPMPTYESLSFETRTSTKTTIKKEVCLSRFEPKVDSLLYEVIEASGIDWLEGCSHFTGFDSTDTKLFSLSTHYEPFFLVEFSGLCGQGNCGAEIYAFKKTRDSVELIFNTCGYIDSISPISHNGLLDFIITWNTFGDPEFSGLLHYKFDGYQYKATEVPIEHSLERKIANMLVETNPNEADSNYRHYYYNNISPYLLSEDLNVIPVALHIPNELTYLVYDEIAELPFLVSECHPNQFRMINFFPNDIPYGYNGPDFISSPDGDIPDIQFHSQYGLEPEIIYLKWNGHHYVQSAKDSK